MNRSHTSLSATTASALVLLGLIALPAFGTDRNWNGIAGDNKWKTAGNWLGGTAPVSGDALFFNGNVGAVNTNDFTAGTAFNGLNFNGPGAFTLWGNSISLNGNVTNNQTATPESINLALGLNVTPTIDVVSNGLVTINRPISGGFGVNKTSPGQFALAATNIFTGPLTALGGTISVASDLNLGAVPGSPTAGSVVLNGGSLLVSSSLTINSNRGIALGPTTGTGVGTMDILSGATLTYGGILRNNG